MKVLINAASAHMGGAVTQLQSILEWLPKKMPSSRVVVYVPETTMAALPDGGGVDIRAYPYASTQGLRRLYFDQIEIPRLVRRTGADLLHSVTGFGTLWSPVPQVLSIRNMAYFDPTYQAKYRELGRSFVERRLRRWHSLFSIWAADVVLFPTQAVQDVVGTYISLERTTTHALHYGNDWLRFAAGRDEGTAPEMLQQHIDGEGPLLLNVSTYAIQKNLETLIEALPRLLDRHPNLTLATTTSREQTSDTDEYDALKERAVELGVEKNWVELGYVPHEELPSVYRAADLYVFPSFTESFGHSMVEAMASGLPVIAADTDVNREVCADAGAYFSTFDPDDCADAIRGVLKSKDQQAEMRRASRQRAEHFSWKRYAERLAEIYWEMRNGTEADRKR